MSLQDNANRAAVLHLLADAFATAAKHEKTLALDEMAGRGTLYPTLPDGSEIARVTVPKASTRVKITDERKLANWVAEHYPTEVEHAPVVRSAFLTLLKDTSKRAGEACAPDGTLDIPGIEVTSQPPNMASVTPTDEGRKRAEAIVEQAQGNAVDYLAGNEIPGGTS